MSLEKVDAVPIPAHLADAPVLYYTVIEHSRFGSLKAMCQRKNWPLEEVEKYVVLAAINQSDLVIMDRFVLGDPESNICAVLKLSPGGGVLLMAGLFNEASEDHSAVVAVAEQFVNDARFKGKEVGVCQFRPNPKGMPQ